MQSSDRSRSDWVLTWTSPFQTHGYEPVYLANGTFGGMLDLSGSTLDLWSPLIGAVPEGDPGRAGILFPVTALRIQAYYRNARHRAQGFWVGNSGIHGDDVRYTSDPSMPHIAQVYGCRQELDLRAGLATTSGKLVLGSQAALAAGLADERAVAFATRVAFLKDSPLLGIELRTDDADTEILFRPEVFLRERFNLGGGAKGVLRIGNDLDCELEMRQEKLSVEVGAERIVYLMRPAGGAPYRVVVTPPGPQAISIVDFHGGPALLARHRLFVTVEILPDGMAAATDLPLDFHTLAAEQRRRWETFWSASELCLPESESLWRQRYRASLFYVAQSMGDGPTHPGGISRPMLPYWFGCFHDTDTYFCRALLESGHAAEAARHLAYRHRGLVPARALAREQGRSGALYPWQCDARGVGPAHDVPVNGAIIACEAWHQHLHSGTDESLAQAADILAAVLDNLSDHLDLSAPPLRFKPAPLMTFSETMVAEDPTEARVALRSVAAAHLEAARRVGRVDPARDALARRILAELSPPLREDGAYAIGSTDDPEYLRCPSVTLGSFPLHHLPADAALARTFEKELARIVFLFAWLPHHASIVASQLRRAAGPAGAAQLLRDADAFYKPWHAFDEWENRRAVRAANFVTAAGGFCLAVHAMLLAETAPGRWSLLPGAPAAWTDLSFRDLHTRAGWIVSARVASGYVVELSARPAHPRAQVPFLLELSRPHPALAAAASSFGVNTGGDTLCLALRPEHPFAFHPDS